MRLLEPTSVILAQAAAACSGAPAIDVGIDHHGVDLSVPFASRYGGKGGGAVLLKELCKVRHDLEW